MPIVREPTRRLLTRRCAIRATAAGSRHRGRSLFTASRSGADYLVDLARALVLRRPSRPAIGGNQHLVFCIGSSAAVARISALRRRAGASQEKHRRSSGLRHRNVAIFKLHAPSFASPMMSENRQTTLAERCILTAWISATTSPAASLRQPNGSNIGSLGHTRTRLTPREPKMEGGCTCRRVRYRLIGTPLIVHACHCRWCQRETGTAHALNALYEADRVVHTADEPEIVVTPSASGKGQKIARCSTCRVAVWSNYPQAGSAIRFVRVGTMDNPDLCPPDIHIYTSSKQPWVTLPPGDKAVPEFYNVDAVWPAESLERRRILRAKAQQA